jgi:hypothetical protein
MPGKQSICLVVTLVAGVRLAGAAPVGAQPNVARAALAVGATVGLSGTGNEHSGGGAGPTVAAFVDVPVMPTWRVRLGAGTTNWRPDVEMPGRMKAGRVALDHVSFMVLRSHQPATLRVPLGLYTGMGAGYYRYRIEQGQFSRRTSAGFHFLGGAEYQKFDRDLGVRVELELHLTGGPHHEQVWAEVIPALSVSIGLSKRF